MKYFVTNGVHDLCVSAIGLVKTGENQGQSTGNRRQAQRFQLSGDRGENKGPKGGSGRVTG